jgi:hypothetical protein
MATIGTPAASGTTPGFWGTMTGKGIAWTGQLGATTAASGVLMGLMKAGVPVAGMEGSPLPMAGTGYDGGVQAGQPVGMTSYPGSGGAGGDSGEAAPTAPASMFSGLSGFIMMGLVVTAGVMLIRPKARK